MPLSNLTCICRSYSSSGKVTTLHHAVLPLSVFNCHLWQSNKLCLGTGQFQKSGAGPSPLSSGSRRFRQVLQQHSCARWRLSGDTGVYSRYVPHARNTPEGKHPPRWAATAGKSQASCPWARTRVAAAFHVSHPSKAAPGREAERRAPVEPRGFLLAIPCRPGPVPVLEPSFLSRAEGIAQKCCHRAGERRHNEGGRGKRPAAIPSGLTEPLRWVGSGIGRVAGRVPQRLLRLPHALAVPIGNQCWHRRYSSLGIKSRHTLQA